MPTPSSREESESLNFNSTCPDDQAPRAQSSWLHPSPPPYEESSPLHTVVASTGSARDGHNGATSQPHQTIAIVPSISAPDSPAMSPVAQHTDDRSPDRDASPFLLNEGGHDDTADKQDDTDEAMTDLVTPTSSTAAPAAVDGRDSRDDLRDRRGQYSVHHTIAGSGLATLRIGHSVAPHVLTENGVWEPCSTSQALRQLDTGSLTDSSRQTAEVDSPSPSTMDGEKVEDQEMAHNMTWPDEDEAPPFLGCDPTSLRMIPSPPSIYLRPGSRFLGTQQSERQVYDVQVEIKHVDLRESFLCGYLRIQGLTEDHPTLTTYFEGEIIGSKYGFNTKHASWGANDRVDMSHWAKFAAFRQFARQAKKGNFMIKEYLQKENIFMRWKEHFLVPDHRVRTIHGASFEGFYYICFNQVEGVVHGIYFHSKSEKFQQLELRHVENKGRMSAVEFR